MLARLPKVGKYALSQMLARASCPLPAAPPATVELLPGLSRMAPEALTQADRHLSDMPTDSFDIAPHVRVQAARSDDFRGCKVALIAHWDLNGLIDPYVMHYAKALKALGYHVLLASDRPVHAPGATLGELPDALDAVIHRTCPGYDFTSWRAALHAFPTLLEADGLVLTNDSIFAPVGDLGRVHAAMDALPCDFWGMVQSQDKKPHLQSYYLVFRPAALRSPAFNHYWKLVGPQTDKEKAITYELNLGLWLARHGLRSGAFSPRENQPAPMLNPTHCGWDHLIEKYGVPLLKRDLIFQNPYQVPLDRLEEILRKQGYPMELILNYAKRRSLRPLFPYAQADREASAL